MAAQAIRRNKQDDPAYTCQHVCIEPFEAPWLEKLGIQVMRTLVEEVNADLFASLNANDILFIDSSHIIRPQGDVLAEYLDILPLLKPGVWVHVHDVFSPRDYPKEWIVDAVRFWNEQYLLEAFLSYNSQFKVIGALNFLKHHYPAELTGKCPVLAQQMASCEPASLWMQRR